ncbi:MAG: hypothetical protein SOI24_09310 [Coriobacteriales bacterium]
MQYAYHPNDCEQDGTPKQGATPLITQQNVDEGLSHRSIKRWAYCWHDKDVIVDEGEAGADGDRDEFERLCGRAKDCTQGVLNYVISGMYYRINRNRSLANLIANQNPCAAHGNVRALSDAEFIADVLPHVDEAKTLAIDLAKQIGLTEDELMTECGGSPTPHGDSDIPLAAAFKAIDELKDALAAHGGAIPGPRRKPRHVHIVAQCSTAVEVASIAKWFGIPENFVDVPKGHGAFLDCVEYLTHENPKEQAKGKHRYDDSEVVASFDFRSELAVRAARREKYGSAADKISPADELKLHVMQDGWSVRRCRQEDPLNYIKVRDQLPKLRLDYLADQPPCPARINLYVDGNGGLGKGVLSDYIAHKMFPNVERPVFTVGNDPRVAFDGYDGEPVIIWDDWRSYQFFEAFGRGGTFNIFDTHPKEAQAQQAKYTRVVLVNAVNIVNSVQPYRDFLDGLAGEYVDKSGEQHHSEDINQSYRRFPLIIHVHEDDLEILLNRGFMDKDSYAYQQYYMSERIRGNLKGIATRLAGDLRTRMLDTVTSPVMDAYNRLLESHDDKISDPDQLPEEFKHYGEVLTPEQAEQEDADKAALAAEAEDMRRIDSLLRFVHAYVTTWHPNDEADVLGFCRDAYSNAQSIGSGLMGELGEAEASQVRADVRSFSPEEVTSFVFREVAEDYYDEVPD